MVASRCGCGDQPFALERAKCRARGARDGRPSIAEITLGFIRSLRADWRTARERTRSELTERLVFDAAPRDGRVDVGVLWLLSFFTAPPRRCHLCQLAPAKGQRAISRRLRVCRLVSLVPRASASLPKRVGRSIVDDAQRSVRVLDAGALTALRTAVRAALPRDFTARSVIASSSSGGVRGAASVLSRRLLAHEC
jgi:hypothetical protein